MKTCGIYKITNEINGKFYIGMSKDVRRRWRDHVTRSKDKSYKEYDKYLYRAFRKYGIENFTFEIVEECKEEELSEREVYWIKFTDATNRGYNAINSWQPDFKEVGEKHPNHKLTENEVIDIRTRYANHERCKEVEALYKDKIGHSGFKKIWNNATWKHIMQEVYTPENKEFHLHNSGNKNSSNGRAKLNEKQVLDIRTRRRNDESLSQVYKDYCNICSKGCFQDAWYGHTWKDIIVE